MQQTVLMDRLFGVNAYALQTPRCLLLILSGAALLTVSSYLSFYLPFSPVPITCQTLAVLLIGLTYGLRLAATTTATWLIAGSLGLPVFAGGKFGIPIFLPTGGYLIGFFVAAVLCAYLAERGWTNSFGKLALAIFLAHVLIYILGLAQLSLFVKDNVLMLGCYPFLIGDVCKATLLIVLLPPVCRWVDKFLSQS